MDDYFDSAIIVNLSFAAALVIRVKESVTFDHRQAVLAKWSGLSVRW